MGHIYHQIRIVHLFFIFGIAIGLLVFTSCQTPNKKFNGYIPYDSEGFTKSDVFHIKVNGEEVFVAKEECFGDSTFHTAQFFVEGKTEIKVESKEPIQQFSIHPKHLNIEGKVEGNELLLNVSRPQMLMVKINGFKPLALFQSPPETDIPEKDNPNVIYFAKGVHKVGLLSPKSGQTIYLEQGAVVKARVYAEGVENVTIKGRGIIDARGFTDKPNKICGLEFKNAKHIRVDGIGLRTGAWWQSLYILCEDVKVTYMNLMSFGVNNDGIDIDGVSDMRVSNCWIGCGDDGFGWHALDAEANGQPPTKNCIADNCVIYNAHAGNGLRVGASLETELFENITFKDITVFAHANAGIRSDHSDWATCKNIRFENFYIEQPGRPIEIRVEKTRYSNSTGYRDERGNFDGLVFENVNAEGGNIILEGYDENHLIENVTFKNSYNAGVKMEDTTTIEMNKYVRKVKFE